MEKYCEKCKAHGYWEGAHDCPPLLAFLVAREKMEYGAATTARESEISREYGRLMKAVKELGMTCENLDTAFMPVLRSRLEPSLSEMDSAKEPPCSTEHGIALMQARNSIEGITRQVRSVLERKEI